MNFPGTVREKLCQLAAKRILILDGAMGSEIQGNPLTENDFRGERFKDHPLPLKGCNDLLCLTRPDIVSEIHESYLEAGADIIETCSFNANAVSLADYGLGAFAYEINTAAARLARKAADAFSSPEKPRFVAGSIGPTSKSASICPNLDDPDKRAVTWDELETAYYDNARGLIDGGADLLIIETVFDTLNAKAAIFAVHRLAEERGIDMPLIVSATVSDNGGRLLSGQNVEAFCVSVLHARPLALGLNCSFGAEKLKPYMAALSSFAPCHVSAHPNAGLPNRLGVYDEGPELMADHIEAYMREGLVNIVGGCCGSKPAHIAAIAERAKKYAPRVMPKANEKTLLAGLQVLEVDRERMLAVAEQPSPPYREEFLKLLEEGDYDGAVDLVREKAEDGDGLIEVFVDDALPGAKKTMVSFLNLALQFPDIARHPVMIKSSRWDVVEAALKCLQGKGLVNFLNFSEGEDELRLLLDKAGAYGAVVMVKDTIFDGF
jgi:5-methyltetrahydrofolate--homocysteine methyltransferase